MRRCCVAGPASWPHAGRVSGKVRFSRRGFPVTHRHAPYGPQERVTRWQRQVGYRSSQHRDPANFAIWVFVIMTCVRITCGMRGFSRRGPVFTQRGSGFSRQTPACTLAGRLTSRGFPRVTRRGPVCSGCYAVCVLTCNFSFLNFAFRFFVFVFSFSGCVFFSSVFFFFLPKFVRCHSCVTPGFLAGNFPPSRGGVKPGGLAGKENAEKSFFSVLTLCYRML